MIYNSTDIFINGFGEIVKIGLSEDKLHIICHYVSEDYIYSEAFGFADMDGVQLYYNDILRSESDPTKGRFMLLNEQFPFHLNSNILTVRCVGNFWENHDLLDKMKLDKKTYLI